jgi:polysaccharide deacetylase 2 family uncharacterized protein YibQ
MNKYVKMILIIVSVVAVAASLFVAWRMTHVPKRKIIVKKHVPAVREVAKKKTLPEIQKKSPRPRVAIVLDDFGYNMNNLDALFSPGLPVTLSVLPNLPYSRRVAELARSKGFEVILHLPLEANDKSAPAESDTIRTDMSEKTINSMLDQELASMPGLTGISNHQGSKATENVATMSVIMADLKKRGLYFFDSLVTDKSVCRDVAKKFNVRYAKRDIFLDDKMSQDYIEKQVLSLRRIAFRRGSAIAVGHDRKNTLAVLKRMMPELSADGIEFVTLSDMVQ